MVFYDVLFGIFHIYFVHLEYYFNYMKKIESIDTFDSLMRVLRRYFGLNGKLDLTPEQKFRKQEYENMILTFLTDFETIARYKDPKNPEYTIKNLKNFLDGHAIPAFSKAEEAEYFDLSYIRLKQIMAEKNLKSREVINATGINQSLFSKILNGDRKPSEEVKQRLSEYFNEDFHKYKY